MRFMFTLVFVSILVLPLQLRAEEQPENSSRTLRGHTFAYPAAIDAAFINTLFGTRTSARYETVRNLPLGNNLIAVDSLGVGMDVDFAVAPLDWFSVGVHVYGRTLVGTSGRALATAGALYSYGGAFDAAFRVLRLEESGTQIALRGQIFGLQGGGHVSLIPLIRAVRNDTADDIPAIVTNSGSLLITPLSWLGGALSANVAQVITQAISVQASFRLDVRRVTQSPYVLGQGRVDLDSTRWLPQAGVAVGFVPPEWPVTFLGEYRLSGQAEDDPTSPARHVVAAAVYYSARMNLQLGPVVAGEFGLPELRGIDTNGDPQGSDRGKAVTGQLMMRYYW